MAEREGGVVRTLGLIEAAELLRQLGVWADLRMVQNYAHHSKSHLASFARNTKKGKP